MSYISNLVKQLKELAQNPYTAHPYIELLNSAAFHLEEQQSEIDSLKAQRRDLSWDIENARQRYEERDRSNEW